MKILYFITNVGLGGHTRSAITIGRALIKDGVCLSICAGMGDGIRIVKESGIPFTILPNDYVRGRNLTLQTIVKAIKVVRSIRPDVIHAFDLDGLILGTICTHFFKTKLVYTICGGPVPRVKVPDMNPIVVFSSELKEGIASKYNINRGNIKINSARIDLNQQVYDSSMIYKFRKKLNIASDKKLILTISRINRTKLKYLNQFIELANSVCSSVDDAIFLIIGSCDDEECIRILRKKMDHVNEIYKKTVISWTDENCTYAAGLLPMADIVIGVGRTALESMTQRLPTLILGEKGYAGLANSLNCDDLYKANFSGRNTVNSDEKGFAKLLDDVLTLINNKKYREQVGREGRQWIEENLNVDSAVTFYKDMYYENEYKPPKTLFVFKRIVFSIAYMYYKRMIPSPIKKKIQYIRKSSVEQSGGLI